MKIRVRINLKKFCINKLVKGKSCGEVPTCENCINAGKIEVFMFVRIKNMFFDKNGNPICIMDN